MFGMVIVGMRQHLQNTISGDKLSPCLPAPSLSNRPPPWPRSPPAGFANLWIAALFPPNGSDARLRWIVNHCRITS